MNIEDRQPAILIADEDNNQHVIGVATLRAIARGQYMGDNDEMMRLLARALVDLMNEH
jgi:hypothetical protein